MSEDDAHLESRNCREIIEDSTRGALVFKRNAIMNRPLRFLKILGPFLLSHHPNCSQFAHHMVVIRGRKYCIGCFFNTIFFFLSLGFLFATWLIDPSFLDRSWLFYGGAVGLVMYLLVSLLHLSEGTKSKIATKFLLGVSFSSIVISIIIAGGSVEYMIQEKRHGKEPFR